MAIIMEDKALKWNCLAVKYGKRQVWEAKENAIDVVQKVTGLKNVQEDPPETTDGIMMVGVVVSGEADQDLVCTMVHHPVIRTTLTHTR